MLQARLQTGGACGSTSSACRSMSNCEKRFAALEKLQRRHQATLPPVASQQQQQPVAAAAAAERAPVPVTFILGGEEITVEAQPGQNLWEVRHAA